MSGIALPIDAVAGSPSFPAAQNRVADAALVAGRSDRALGAVSGFRPAGEPVVSVTSARVWTATPSNGVIDPGTSPTVGPYRFAFLANETGTLAPADANFSRFDRLDIQVPDDPAGASPLAAVYVVTTGVAQSSPQVPAAPARSFPVGVFTVPNLGNPSFAATWPRTAAAGGIILVRAGVRPANPYIGQYIDDATAGLLRWSGTAWVPVGGVTPMAAGVRPSNPTVGQYIDDASVGLMRWTGASWVKVAPYSGSAAGNTDASGYVVVTHGLGFTPSRVMVTSRPPAGFSYISSAAMVGGVDVVSATSFRVRMMCLVSAGLPNCYIAAANNLPYAFDWMATP